MELSIFKWCFGGTTFITAGTVVLLLLYILIIKKPRNYPPGPIGLPLVGYLPFLGENAAETLRKLKSKYGSVISVQMGRENWIILNDYRTINEAFIMQGDKFSGRPKNFMIHLWTKGYGVLNTDYGRDFKIMKKFLTISLRGFGNDKKQMEESINEESSFLLQNLTTKNNLTLAMKISLAVSNIICRVAFGSRLPYNDKRLNTVLNNVRETFSDTSTAKIFGLFMIAPALRHIPPFTKGFQDLIRRRNILLDVWRDIVKEHEQSYDEENIRDLIDAFLTEMKAEGETSPVFCADQLLQLIRDLFEAGTSTTTGTLLWCLLCLASYPEYQEKIYNEIQTVVGNDGTTRMKHRNEMHYTCAFIQELMRHRTLVPLGLPHKTSEETTINGYTIPKNTMVSANIWAVHLDPDFFEDPNVFRPERFLDMDGKFIDSKHMIPFSVGPRHCLGKQIAKMEIFMFLTSIVQKLKILPSGSKPLPPFTKGSSYNMLAYEPLPFDVSFQRR